ncbi:MAG: tetratricopeptide repeat protein [Proteobacteria bacterium]|nr:tetratricopeptide repeat protein [Pseudomonadota bacterium]
MNFRTFTSSLALTILIAKSSVFAMDEEQENPSALTLPKKRALPTPPSTKAAPSAEPTMQSAPPKKDLSHTIVARRNFSVCLDANGNNPEAVVRRARALVSEIEGTTAEDHLTPYLNLARVLINLGNHHPSKIKEYYEEAYALFITHVPDVMIYSLLNTQGQRFAGARNQEISLPALLKDVYIYSGEIARALGKYPEAINRVERGLSIIDDDPDFNPEKALLTAALAAYSQAVKPFGPEEINTSEEHHILAATYFESYFKLNPKQIKLDFYVKAALSAWKASQSDLATAWRTLEHQESRLEIKHAIGPFQFSEQSNPFVSASNRWDFYHEKFIERNGNIEEIRADDHLYQAHMRALATSWIAKVEDTTNVTQRLEELQLKNLYERLRTALQTAQIDDSAVKLNPEGYVSYVKPNLQRYLNEANAAIENKSWKYALFLADQVAKHFPDQQGDLTAQHIRDKARQAIAKQKQKKLQTWLTQIMFPQKPVATAPTSATTPAEPEISATHKRQTLKQVDFLQDWVGLGLVKTNPIPVTPGQKLTVTCEFDSATDVTAIDFINTAQNAYYSGGVVVKIGETKATFSSIVPEGETQTWLIIRNPGFNGHTPLPLGVQISSVFLDVEEI